VGAGGPPSLKGRALRALSQREHSRVELARKLAPHAESTEQLDRVLDELQRGGFLSDLRFAQSLAHRRSARYGLRRIEQELGTHRLEDGLAQSVLGPLRNTERDRALAVWRKRFGSLPADGADRARQQRFLAQRGFAAETIFWVLRHGASGPDTSADPSTE
jgi:regulatory protein